jgi:hypothetical protein
MAASGTRAPHGMPMDVYRSEDSSYHVEVDLPGADPDSVEETVEHGVLTIHAQRTPHYGESEQIVVAERPQGSFTRQLPRRGRGFGEPDGRLRRRCPARGHPRIAKDPSLAGSRSLVRPAAAAPSLGASSSRVTRPPAAPAAPAESLTLHAPSTTS